MVAGIQHDDRHATMKMNRVRAKAQRWPSVCCVTSKSQLEKSLPSTSLQPEPEPVPQDLPGTIPGEHRILETTDNQIRRRREDGTDSHYDPGANGFRYTIALTSLTRTSRPSLCETVATSFHLCIHICAGQKLAHHRRVLVNTPARPEIK